MKAFITAAGAVLIAAASARFDKRQAPSTVDIKSAVQHWQANTETVSAFLDSAATFQATGDNNGFVAAAANALAAENDELNWKAILDAELCQTGDATFDQSCQAAIFTANQTLVADLTFGHVVFLLGEMVNNGLASIGDVNSINFGDSSGIGGRCPYVLPAITTYFVQAEMELDLYGDFSEDNNGAVYPQACL
jgi:hypothetical protein